MSQPESPEAANAPEPADPDDLTTDDAQPVQLRETDDSGVVPDKQIYRWKDDGGALPPGS